MGAEELGLLMQGNTLQRLAPNATKEQQTAVINNILDRLNELVKSQTFSDDTSKRYVQGFAPGRWPGGDFGIAISAEGEDVLGADFADLIFAWDFTTNKQYIRGGTQLYYDTSSGANIGQIGVLPNGRNGQAWSKDGETIDGAFGV